MKVDPRFLTGEGLEIFTGNELLIKGALETEGGVHLLGGYPGSPVAGFFDTMSSIKDLLNEKGIYAVQNNNEALSAAMLNGTQTIGCKAMIVMKSVGVHVAADALALGSLAGAHPDGGAIVVYGDDPWEDSTQVPADSRYLSKHLFIPVFDPSNAQEVKDFVNLSFKVSAGAELYSGFVLPTNLADGGGTVKCSPNQYPVFNTRQKRVLETARINLDKFVLLPPRTWWQEKKYAARFDRAIVLARQLGLNKFSYKTDRHKPLGFISSGLAHDYLIQALEQMGLLGEFPILKFGMSYPADAVLVNQLGDQVDKIIVVEERRGFVQEQVAEVLIARRQTGAASDVELWGNELPGGLPGIPTIRGLHPSMLIELLAPLVERFGLTGAQALPEKIEKIHAELATIKQTASVDVGQLPLRCATFCPGCPHRDSANVCLQIKKDFMDAGYMQRTHNTEPVDLLFHGDTGCYTMLLFPPNDPLMSDYSGMGLGGGTGSGTDKFITNKEVVFMGDSTFFHSGQIAISQAVKLGQDITFIILDNSTTAMTGHQPTPGVDYDVLGNLTAVQDIEDIVSAITGSGQLNVVRVDPEQREQYRQLLAETFLADGVKVVIADKECGITYMRRKRRNDRVISRRLGYLPRREHMNINTDLCKFCLACAEQTACPGLKHVPTDYGPKMNTDISWCVADGACERVGACSAFERVTIKRKKKPRSRVPELHLDDIPEPQKRPPGELWRCCLTGVGGMGLGVATSILVRAGHKEGYPVLFLDKKGLAIRNGGTVSQVVYNIAGKHLTAVLPYGGADLLIGIDILEAARALDPAGRVRAASPEKTAAVLNTDKISTIGALMGRDNFDPDELAEIILSQTRADDYLARDIARICEKYLGSKLYANTMMLGFAFQKGLIPVSMHSIAWAIKDTIRTDFRKNLYAFNMGRKLVDDPDLFLGPPVRTGWEDNLDAKCRWTIRRNRRSGQAIADRLRRICSQTIDACESLDGSLKRDIVIRAYDCMRWGGIDYATRYTDAVVGIYEKDLAKYDYAATRAVIHTLAKAMLIKDGVFAAELATAPEKYASDREKYSVNRSNGDRIEYRHQWRIDWLVGSWRLRFALQMRPWQLKLLRRMKILRKLLPRWHGSARRFRESYEQLVAGFAYETYEQYSQQLSLMGSPGCMTCMIPRCSEAGCPLGSRIPEWIELAGQGKWPQAADILHETNNFPEFTARICPAPCQFVCKHSHSGPPVQIRQLEKQVIDRAFESGFVTPQIPPQRTDKRVAVIGSGPAGLAAAQQLARSGHEVTVFEKDSALGGLLRYGIPDHRLASELIDRRVEQMTAEGVQFNTGQAVGEDISAAQLASEYDAVLIAVGAARPRDLNIPGRQIGGITFAMDFLRSASPDNSTSLVGKKVAVIGGGLTGEDCVELAIAQGADEVNQLEILPKEKANGQGLEQVELEKIRRRWSVSVTSFEGNSQVSALKATRVSWAGSPAGAVMSETPGGQFGVEADLIVLALGYDAVIAPVLVEQLGLTADSDGKVIVRDYSTQVEGVFAAGDLETGASKVATAIASGRAAAERINGFLGVSQAKV